MTAAEWWASVDPTPMIRFLGRELNDRKLKLFGIACCRTVWPSLSSSQKDAIRTAEEYLDGKTPVTELGSVITSVNTARRKGNYLDRAVYDAIRSEGDAAGVADHVARAVAKAAAPNPSPTAMSTILDGEFRIVKVPPNADRLAWNAAYTSHLSLEASLLRDIIGPSAFHPIGAAGELLEWRDDSLAALARYIHDNHAYNLLPRLADGLGAAGCNDEEILSHCRLPGNHVRGCWVIDLLMGYP